MDITWAVSCLSACPCDCFFLSAWEKACFGDRHGQVWLPCRLTPKHGMGTGCMFQCGMSDRSISYSISALHVLCLLLLPTSPLHMFLGWTLKQKNLQTTWWCAVGQSGPAIVCLYIPVWVGGGGGTGIGLFSENMAWAALTCIFACMHLSCLPEQDRRFRRRTGWDGTGERRGGRNKFSILPDRTGQ